MTGFRVRHRVCRGFGVGGLSFRDRVTVRDMVYGWGAYDLQLTV